MYKFPECLLNRKYFHKLNSITIPTLTLHQVLDKQSLKPMKNHLGILIWIFLHQVLDYQDVHVHDFTLLLLCICWLFQPIFTVVHTNSMLLVYLCWLFQPLVKTIHTFHYKSLCIISFQTDFLFTHTKPDQYACT